MPLLRLQSIALSTICRSTPRLHSLFLSQHVLRLSRRGFKTPLSESYSGIHDTRHAKPDESPEVLIKKVPTSSPPFTSPIKRFLYGQSSELPNVKLPSLMELLKRYRGQPALQERVLEGYYTSWYNKKRRNQRMQLVDVVPGLVLGCLALTFAYKCYQEIKQKLQSMGTKQSLLTDDPSLSASQVTFDEVKGCDEAKKELKDIVEFLRFPERFTNIGAKLPKGVLLVGPPGVGKTLLARAVAGEAKVPIFQASGSDFDDMFVGVGVLRLRKLFQSARANAPCIIFIDEFDTLGRKRTSGPRSPPYANQTINQLLVELDGFESTQGIIVLAATNLKEKLDKAVLRPGRFDLEVNISPPDVQGRTELYRLYLNKIPLDPHNDWNLTINQLALKTVGFTGADIQNIVNQASTRAAMLNQNYVRPEDLWYAIDKITMGPSKEHVQTPEDIKRTAYHEAGHTLATLYTSESVPLHKVTILPRNQSLGHTSFLLDKERYGWTKQQLKARLDVALGGRVGEELIYGNAVADGAANDFKEATKIAEEMVRLYGMSDKIGPRVIPADTDVSDSMKELIDSEVQRLLSESLVRVRKLLSAHSSELDSLAKALLKYETLDAESVTRVIQGKMPIT